MEIWRVMKPWKFYRERLRGWQGASVYATGLAICIVAFLLGIFSFFWYLVSDRHDLRWGVFPGWVGVVICTGMAFLLFVLVRSIGMVHRRTESSVGRGREIEQLREELRKAAQALDDTRAEELARRAELELLMETVPAAVLISHDPEGHYITGNSAAYEHIKMPRETNLSSIFLQTNRGRIEARQNGRLVPMDELPMLVAARTGQPILDVELEFRHPDGSSHWVYGNAVPVLDTNGKVRGSLGAFVDITGRKKAEQAREKLAAIVESSEDAIISINLEGLITSWNAGATRLFGYEPTEMIGLPMSLLAPPERLQEELNFLRRVRQGSCVKNFETERMAKDGRRIEVSVSLSPVRDEAGRIIGTSQINRDITDRKRAEAALRRSEERFRMMAETLPDIIFTCHPDGWTNYCNQRFYDYTGLPPGSVVGYQCLKSVHPADRERTMREWKECFRTGRAIEIQHRLRAADGNYRWFLIRARPIHDFSGNLTQWFGACTDIEDQKHAEKMLEETVSQRTAKLQETIGELEHYSYSITHDLRAPLRAIHGFAKLLQEIDNDNDNTAAPQEYLERIITATRRMDQLLQDTLNYGKMLREEMVLESVDLGALLRGMVDTYPSLQLPRAEVNIKGSFPRVLGNQAALTHCCSNLLDNAVKFVASGTLPHVTVWAENRGEWVRFWFEDNGIGIPKEVQEKIFGMFQRLNKEFAGTGIGLAVVRKAVERMGGKVGVESEPGYGSQFWLELRPANQGLGDEQNASFSHSVRGR